jgi:Saxitoxin biosynthesis operon protein SxtJ
MLLGCWPLLHGFPPRWYLVIPAAFLVTFGLVAPRLLAPLNHAWMWLGLMLHRVVAPVLMGIVFFGVILPIGVVMRLRGKDLLRLRFDHNATSYWIIRDPPGPAPEGLKNQF